MTSPTVHCVLTPEQAESIDALVDSVPRVSRSMIMRLVVARGLAGLDDAAIAAALQTDERWLRRQPASRRSRA